MTSVEVTAQTQKTLTQRYIVLREDRQVRVEKMLENGCDVLVEQIILEAKKLLIDPKDQEVFIDVVVTLYPPRPETTKIEVAE